MLYAEGCHLYKDKVQGLAEEKDRFKEALIMAEQSDVVVMCLGLDATIEGEEGMPEMNMQAVTSWGLCFRDFRRNF